MKKLILFRGPSGCGKSTHACELVGEGQIFSTDDFYGVPYNFNPAKLSEAHQWNQLRALRAMVRGVTPVVIDNTNITFWQMKAYVLDAQACGYEIEIVEPRMPWAFNIQELVKRNQHGVPMEGIVRMVNSYEREPTIEKILASQEPQRR